MGRLITPKYALYYRDNTPGLLEQSGAWNVTDRNYPGSGYGRPTAANLERWVRAFNKSMSPGEVNHHVSKALGYLLHVSNARIVRQKDGRVMAEYRAPLFETF